MRTTILLLFFSILSLHAQTPAPTPPPRFRTLGLGVNSSDLFYMLKDKDINVSISEDMRSDFYELPAGDRLAFYKVTKAADSSIVRIPVVDVAVSSGGKMPLLIFSPDPAGSPHYKVEVVADDLASFPAGTFRVLNRTDVPLGCLLGGSPTVVPAHGIELLSKKPPEGMHTLFFQVYPVGSNNGQPLYSNNWAWNPILRTLVVAAPLIPPATAPSIRRIVESTDVLSAPPTQPTTP